MTEAVVHELEVIEVEEKHGQQGLGSGGWSEGVLKSIEKQGTIGQPAQGVMERLVFELLFEALALAHVPQGQDDPFDRRVAEEVVGHNLDVTPRAVAVADTPLSRDGHASRNTTPVYTAKACSTSSG